MARMKAAQIGKPGAEFEVVEREIPEPGPLQVRIKVEACGVCHSDVLVKDGLWPGLQYPRVPGHEISGHIDALGANVRMWKPGQRVGVGWHGGHCFECEPCRRGDFILCRFAKVTGISYDGGYAEYVVVPQDAVAAMPDGLAADEAAPLLCAGITVFNSMRNSGTGPGELVAIQGIGGLGHLAIQYAARMGYRTVAIGRGADKEQFAKKLGALAYIDSGTSDAAKELQQLGGARLIVATAPDAKAMGALQGGLGPAGELLVIAPPGPISVETLPLVLMEQKIQGWSSGTAMDSEDTLNFSAMANVRPMIEKYPLSKVGEAYQQMMSGKARFRVVLTMQG